MDRGWLARALGLAAALGGARCSRREPAPPPPAPVAAPVARFVGAAACATCHAREAAAWSGSHHQLAMQLAGPSTVRGDFADATFTHAGVPSRFFRRDGKYWARTDGPDGALHEYPITHTFGVSPLQQYLVAFPGGRLQALAIAWDSRPARDGGWRWFHLHPDERIASDDPLHWTGATERWNDMCADCHSTNVRKGYDARSDRYATRFDEMSVACEACHGPGSLHVAAGGRGGLPIALDERAGVTFAPDAATGKPRRSSPRTSQREIEMCARCHARRGLLHEDHVHGQPVGDDYRVALLDEDLYFPDGQVKGEVYEYGSFLQSRMFAAGVTCSDCHDPHRPELRGAAGNLCLKCHDERYASARHHFHRAGARCIDCHMAPTTFMVVDARRDHSFRVPRPDLSVKLGVPNACNGCHANRPASWAARTVEKWYGHAPAGLQRFAEALAAGTEGAPGAQRQLAALVADPGQPAIARASALARMQRPLAPEVARAALDDADALVRRAAAHALAEADPRLRAQLLPPRLDDPVRAVRIEAAAATAGVPDELLSSAERDARARATAELIAAAELNGDRPDGHLDLAILYARQARPEGAESELRRALAIDPAFVPAAVNLVDLYRTIGRDDEAEPILREALRHAPENPALLHALGLVMVRQKRVRESLDWLEAAARLGAENPRFGYVYAVALHDAGQPREALRGLEAVLRRRPYDRDTLAALVAFYREAGDPRAAQPFVARLEALGAYEVPQR
jgi:tetratricopeptide (TPR) repeat protein